MDYNQVIGIAREGTGRDGRQGRGWSKDPLTWATKNESLERLNSISETNKSFDVTHVNGWVPDMRSGQVRSQVTREV